MIGPALRLVRTGAGRREVMAYGRYLVRTRSLASGARGGVRVLRRPPGRGRPPRLRDGNLAAASRARAPLPLAPRPPETRPFALEIPEDDPERELARHRFGHVAPLLAAGCRDDELRVEVDRALDWSVRHPARPGAPGWDSYSVAERIAQWVLLGSAASRWRTAIPTDALDAVILAHGEHLARAPEFRGEFTNNHLVNDGRALYLAGAYLGEDRLRRAGAEHVLYGVEQMITPSGFLREASSHYHLLVTRTLLEVTAAAGAIGDDPVLEEVGEAASRACARAEFLLATGTLPLVGDVSPDVPAGFLDGIPAAAAALLPKHAPAGSRPSDLGWHRLFATDLADDVSPEGESDPVASFPDAGYYRARAGGPVVTAFVNPLGHVPGWSHGHSDLGAFVLDWDGPWLVDGGRSSYGATALGTYGRTVRAHNSVSMDGFEPMVVHGLNGFLPPMLSEYAAASPRVEIGREAWGARLSIAHDGFARLAPGLRVTRTIEVRRRSARIVDDVGGTGRRMIESFFHLHPRVRVARSGPAAVLLEVDRRRLTLRWDDGARVEIVRGRTGSAPLGWYSPAYGQAIPAAALHFSRRGLPSRVEYVLEEDD